MLTRIKRYKIFAIFGLLLLVWVFFFIFVEPEAVVARVGIENTYFVAFILAVIGGLSALTGTSFFLAVATFAGSGANPLLLGIIGGLGIFISDTIFFLLAKYGVEVFKDRIAPTSRWLTTKIEGLGVGAVLIFVYLYIGFTPLPNDILMVALALSGMTYRRLAPVLILGSITVVTLTAYLGEAIFDIL
jgi:hypothetical protein